MKNQKGFSLIELLIVVIIIAIIAAIAIPNLLAARRAANEATSISSLRTIHGAQATYLVTAGGNAAFGTLEELCNESLIDAVLGGSGAACASGAGSAGAGNSVKSGYRFTSSEVDATGGNPARFATIALPVTTTGVTKTGTREFGVATEGVIVAKSTAGTKIATSGGSLTLNSAAPIKN